MESPEEEFWEQFWEHRYIQRHGCPSRGIWQDIRSQVAFIYESLVNPTPYTDFSLIDIIIRNASNEISSSMAPEPSPVHVSLQMVQDQLARLVGKLHEFHLRMDENPPDISRLILHQLRESSPQRQYNTNLGPASGVILDLAVMNERIEGAINLVTQITSDRFINAQVQITGDSMENIPAIHAFSSVSDLSPPDANVTYSTRHHELPSYNESIHGIRRDVCDQPEPPLEQPTKDTKSSRSSSFVKYCPRFDPPTYVNNLPPDYWREQPDSVRSTKIRRRLLSSGSNDSKTCPYRPSPGASLLDGIRQISSCFITDPRSRHSSQCATQLGIQHRVVSTAVQTRPRRHTTVQRNVSNPTAEDMIAYVLGQRRSLAIVSRSSSSDSSSLPNAMDYEFFSDLIPEAPITIEPEGQSDEVSVEPDGLVHSDRTLDDNQFLSSRGSLPSPHRSPHALECLSRSSSPFSFLGMDPNLITALEGSRFPTDVEVDVNLLLGNPSALAISSDTSDDSKARTDKAPSSRPSWHCDEVIRPDNISEENGMLSNLWSSRFCPTTLSRHCAKRKTRNSFGSVDYLAYMHEEQCLVDNRYAPYHRRLRQIKEESFLDMATECWLPLDIQRRRRNRFEVLSLHGDTSQLEYLDADEGQTCSSGYLDYVISPPVASACLRGGSSDADRTRTRMRSLSVQSRLASWTKGPTLSRTSSLPGLRTEHHSDVDSGSSFEQFRLLFINSRGNEYFCEIDEDYLTDRFNLTSLNTEVQYYQYALDLITDVLDIEVDDDTREQIEKSARHLYGLVHARYIVTTRGLAKMCEKYKNGDFGKCPRVACEGQPLLPMGQHDNANTSAVKLYCARCEDLYNPKSSRHASVDGAYFGSSFHNMFFQIYPNLMPPKSQKRYEPRIFGFRVHAPAALARWQSARREELKEMVRNEGLETGFEEEEREEEMEESEGEEENAQDGIDDMFEGQRAAYQ